MTTAIKERKEAESAKARLSLMVQDRDVFVKQLKENRRQEHQVRGWKVRSRDELAPITGGPNEWSALHCSFTRPFGDTSLCTY